jgi:hypothetical protein
MSDQKHKTAVGRLLAAIGGFIVAIFHSAGAAFNNLPPDQQKATIDGTNISQILKTGYKNGAEWVLDEITKVTGLPSDVAEQTVLHIAKENGVNTASVQEYLDHIADKVQAGVTDNKWNAIWQDIAKFAAGYLTQGKLDWVTLSLGIIEYALQTFVKL